MYKSRYNCAKKRSKCDVTIRSTITKETINRKKKWLKQLKKNHQKINKIGEMESRLFLVMDNLEEIRERCQNEVPKNLYKF